MSKIKVSELFYSIQGEGRYMGVPSVFLRTFGCNFKCPSFGLHHGEKTTEVITIIKNLDNPLYTKYKQSNKYQYHDYSNYNTVPAIEYHAALAVDVANELLPELVERVKKIQGHYNRT